MLDSIRDLWLALPVALFLALLFLPLNQASAYERKPQKPAIVLAAFGTTDVEALDAILTVEKKVKAAFPDYDVHLAFTSNIIRDIWHERAGDREFRQANSQVPESMYEIKNPLTTLALIQEDGSRNILVQSLHVTNGSEFNDQKNIVTQLAAIKAHQESKKPFPYIVIGDSAFGAGTPAELERAAKALEPLAARAKSEGATLVLMGHGNEHLEVKAYRDFGAAMTKMYGQPIQVALVEGEPAFDGVRAELKKAKVKKVLLAPMMLVAGDHAKNDMAGDEEDSWATMLKADGIEVIIHLEGLGLNSSWADIYVERLKALDAEMKKAAE
ncbi:sirohydrochlorin cobaltochelatase [Deltaproteobacteria bacterium OttesenSCG-928-M10]|nr:sirohydrochlorin cobaltochelatase [Deltaproteobacteria bacterium OttesenSCG-928-M10]